ncbi:hypothetical protein [Amycolatopsis vancoresmycina]|uniref:hypothetical protein n=1 Tax=Amycolatopsis vancoresmycina TaxID=208444 RepID=UPI0012DD23AF|nr:hypothetical protein [Amycolatopsis vancoresmycina]
MTKVDSPDDSGARTFDRFHWQACMAAADGLAAYRDSLTSEGALQAGLERSVLCERHEDWVVISGQQAELVSAKHRDPEVGAWKSINELVTDGGLAHLFARWATLGKKVRARLVTNSALAAGGPRLLQNTIAELRDFCDTGAPAGTDEAILQFMKALRRNGRDLPPHWREPGAGSKTTPEAEKKCFAEVCEFLSVLDIDDRRHSRDVVDKLAPSEFVKPVLDQLGRTDADPNTIWLAVRNLFIEASRRHKPIPSAGLPIILTSVLNGGRTPEQLRNDDDLAARTVTLTDIDAAVRSMIAPLPQQAATAHAIDVRVDSIHAMSSGWFHAFSRQDAWAAARLAARSTLPRDQEAMDALFSEQLALGAYVLTSFGCPAAVMLACHNKTRYDVVIRDISVSERVVGKIIDGVVFWIESGGWNEHPITFNLDAAYPRARLVNEGTDLGSYFEKRSICVQAGKQVTIPVMLNSTRASHVFKLRVKYDINGSRHALTVDNNGQPFRVSPVIMHGGEPVEALPAAERDHLRSLSYLDAYLMHYDAHQVKIGKCAPEDFPGYWRETDPAD